MKKIMIENLLKEGKVFEHNTYQKTGIVCANLKPVEGNPGKGVDFAYISEKEIDIVGNNNVHYGYGHFTEDGKIADNSNRAVFEII